MANENQNPNKSEKMVRVRDGHNPSLGIPAHQFQATEIQETYGTKLVHTGSRKRKRLQHEELNPPGYGI